MAIAFARGEFVKRTGGKNACAKASYIAREKILFKGTKFQEATVYDFKWKVDAVYHEVLLPDHVNEKFKNIAILWNAVEQKETRKDSQVAFELVVALPDDTCITLEDRIQMLREFTIDNFVKKGLAAQINIHPPDAKLEYSDESGKMVKKDHNWHGHILVTTRKFKENGLELDDQKARDLQPSVSKGKVIQGDQWGKIWANYQNTYFRSKGINLQVDHEGITHQEHLGPVRMRGRAFGLMNQHLETASMNLAEVQNPQKILDAITEYASTFNDEDLDRFLNKHGSGIELERIRELKLEFWQQSKIIPLLEKASGKFSGKFTTDFVIQEEKKIDRIASNLVDQSGFSLSNNNQVIILESKLTQEQKNAFRGILNGSKLSLIEGYAGAGKGYLLASIKDAYENEGFIVRALGPDNATVKVLTEKGFQNGENVPRFLYGIKNNRRPISKGKEIWVVDEVSKLGNRSLLELLKKADLHDAKVILAGCTAQLSSVERGGMFTYLCEKHGAFVLEEIHRQKTALDKSVSMSLAKGELAGAIDKIVEMGGFKWCPDKCSSIENLIQSWAEDTYASPERSSILIAYTNREIRALNEMARMIRKGRGEISSVEYECKTAFGDIFVSENDLIEFRKNDKSIGVSNGLSGILIKASADEFIVRVSDEKRFRDISFNPKIYNSYQLGYASTNFRSQGRTVDQAYILMNRGMSKEDFYVSMTRHVNRVKVFISKEEISCLSDLKAQLFRSSSKNSTLNYTTEAEIKRQEQHDQVESLRNSEAISDRLKGNFTHLWGALKSKVTQSVQKFTDTIDSNEYYTFQEAETLRKGDVSKVIPEIIQETKNLNIDKPSIVTRILSVEKTHNSNERILKNILKEGSQQERVNQLSDVDKKLVDKYLDAINRSSSIKTLLDTLSDQSGKPIEAYSEFKEWQHACGERNAAAYELKKGVSKKALEQTFNRKSIDFITNLATRYENSQDNRNERINILQDKLVNNIEPVLHSLFPDGPTFKNGTTMRFRSKGSLVVKIKGSKQGSFYDHKNLRGGGILKLIQQEMGCEFIEAVKWGEDLVGNPQFINVPQSKAKIQKTPENNWISSMPQSESAPSFTALKSKGFSEYREDDRYAYRDLKGKLCFYTIRLVKQDDPTKKVVLPLSYGQWEKGNGRMCWAIKKPTGPTPIFNGHLLNNNPQNTVVIVEGEKTAKAAQNDLGHKGFTVISWMGGVGAINRIDWSPIRDKKVIIWPDNDKPGFDAADNLAKTLKREGVSSLKIVDRDTLEKEFPKKWDLADPLPAGKSLTDVMTLLKSGSEIAIDPSMVISQLNGHGLKWNRESYLDKSIAHSYLWRVDERLRESLEQKYAGNQIKIREEIIKETANIIAKTHLTESTNPSIPKSEFSRFLAHQIGLYEAREGKTPSESKINELKNAISNQTNIFNMKISSIGTYTKEDIRHYAVHKSLESICQKEEKHIPYMSDMPIACRFEKTLNDLERPQEKLIEKSRQFGLQI
jgi:Ti-type conjugative transfer relaxase TraA